MIYRKVETKDYSDTIKSCWTIDPEIQKFSRNHNCDLDERVKREVAVTDLTSDTFKFYKLYSDDNFVGYFGKENEPMPFLTTIFIMPEYRDRKQEIWDYIITHFPDTFYSGLFAINTRAISFFKKMGGIVIKDVIVEDKSAVVFEFRRQV